ncbi:hypothetical protein BpOF4_06205 [Alkalihalophilus pseudofirmus OF4]|uniref:Uncharacterized protein n=1 Tax=Alkalihalophilus pseudofirmus (strain ATCC BAA-2126 / JCM 17055 / OF4) TaxID=398511 RepID=D3FZR1_ALKPO|nr:hypothetical protein BpOF4_06205 [Alkalihalophilus pseudofirmus OF4]
MDLRNHQTDGQPKQSQSRQPGIESEMNPPLFMRTITILAPAS